MTILKRSTFLEKEIKSILKGSFGSFPFFILILVSENSLLAREMP